MARKTESISIRVPGEIRKAIKWGAKKTKKSQSDFMTESVQDMLDLIRNGEPVQTLLLPERFSKPRKEPKTITVRVTPEDKELIDALAPRLFMHNSTSLVLWAVLKRAYELNEVPNTKAQAAPTQENPSD